MVLAALSIPIDANFTHIDFTQSCPNISLGVKIYNQYFNSTVTENFNLTGNVPATTDNTGPANYSTYLHGWRGWSDGTPQDWINFWRDVLPKEYNASSDEEVVQLTNHTDFFAFFDYAYSPTIASPLESQVNLTNVTSFSTYLVSSGGCQNNVSQLASDKSLVRNGTYTLTNMIEDCMLTQCCPLPLDSNVFNDQVNLFPGTPWTNHDACSFYITSLCSTAVQGNPDLGGIGIIVSYLMEAILLAITWIVTLFKFVPAARGPWSRNRWADTPSHWAQHWEAFWESSLEGAAVFLDAAVYFSLSVSIASIAFTYRTSLPIYESKLDQITTLLAIDTPVTLLLLIYQEPEIERNILRYCLVFLAAMMTFGEQFLFRTQVLTNLHCNVFTKAWANEFEMLFKVKAVWAALVAVFFAVQLVEWFIRSRRVLFLQEPDNPRRSISKPRDELHPLRYVIAVVLAAYGVVDCFVEVMYIMAVRKPEQGLNDWGYGQILAVLIWAPVIVEFVHAVIKPFRGIHKKQQKSPPEVSDDNQVGGERSDERKPARMSEKIEEYRGSGVTGDTKWE